MAKASIEVPGKENEATEKMVDEAHMTTANIKESATGGILSSNALVLAIILSQPTHAFGLLSRKKQNARERTADYPKAPMNTDSGLLIHRIPLVT